MRSIRFILLYGIIFISLNAYGQSVTVLVSAIDSFAVRMPSEKLYLHIDKPYYNNTDTIWLKAYILDNHLDGSAQSGLLYTELINDTGRVVLRQVMPVLAGLSWGQIALDSLQVPEGSYTLRAYTNWMQNLGGDGFFTRPLYIGKADADRWVVKAGSKTAVKAGKENTEIALQLLGQDGDPVRLQDLQLRLTEGSKTWLREKMQTDIEGKLRFNFDVPPKAGRLTLVAAAGNGSQRIVVPLHLNREANADVQFMPEGGQLVAGLQSKTGFKAVDEDGEGVDVRGIVLDSKGAEVAAFQSAYRGIGSFLFTPAANETYVAKVTLAKGRVKTYPLPVIKPSGMVFTVNNLPGRDSIILAIQATADMVNASGSYSLIGQNGGNVFYASAVSFKNGSNTIYGRVAKNKFPTGVARFTLFGNAGTPIAERIIFIDHRDRLNINIATDKQNYQPNDSVSLSITVTDKDNNPVQGSFSLAVTDDSQVKADSTNIADISTYMLLTSELKGSIEQPGYYFSNPTPETELNLDNLLLTQGWVAYDWKQVFDKPASPKYRAEKDFEVSGTVKRLNKVQAGLKVNLLSIKKGLLFRDTVTNVTGRFIFNDLPSVDTPSYVLQVKDKRGKMFEANIYMDEFTPAGALPATAGLNPWYVNSDSTVLNYSRQNIAMQRQAEKMKYPAGSNVLREVVIKGRKKIKGSKFFAGSGAEPDLVLDENDMIKAGPLSLEDVLIKNVKGFAGKPFPCKLPKAMEYMVFCNKVILFLDGIPIDFDYSETPNQSYYAHYIHVRTILQTIKAPDVRGIELKNVESAGSGVTIIEITTWSGSGPFMKRTHNRALYRPMPLTWPKEFYQPKYTAQPNPLFDLRSTLHWQPGIATDTGGKARMSFYLKSKKAAYTLIVQGADLMGHTGSIQKKIIVFPQ